MRKRNTTKKLKLHRETLLSLTQEQMQGARGGIIATTQGCALLSQDNPTLCCATCGSFFC